MNASELLKRLNGYGADVKGIADRFSNDDELYLICFKEMLSEPNIALLDQAVAAEEYEAAFAAAHALKGLVGNMGLTPCYRALCTLVESLRAQRYADVAVEYEAVRAQLARLRALLQGEPAA